MKYMTDAQIQRSHDELLRQMAEPEDLRELRRQAKRIEDDKRRAREQGCHEIEKMRLRRQIEAAGEVPCR